MAVVTAKRKQIMLWTGIMMVLAILLLPMTGYIATGFAADTVILADAGIQGQSKESPSSKPNVAENKNTSSKSTNPRSDYWRMVKNNQQGYSAVKGQESNELIQGSGHVWQQLRDLIGLFGGLMLGATLAVLALFYIWRGQVPLNHQRTGQTVERWTLRERRMHWITASLFILLAITGLSLLYGRTVLIPLFGHQGFSTYAEISKWIHNILGPVFMVGLLSMIVSWFSQNFLTKIDIQWFKEFGGMIGDKHPSAEKMNGGEKLWFWSLATIGIALCVSGLILDFPNFGQQREVLQLSHLIHLLSAFVLISFAFGHIYIGTIGTEGALEGMVTGQVDTAWAKQHHDLWLKDLEKGRD